MKKPFFYFAILFIIFGLMIPSLFAKESEKKSDEANKPEIKLKDNTEKEKINDLISEIRRQREEIQSLREEINNLRMLIGNQPQQERPLIRRGEGELPRRLESEPQPPQREFREPERLESRMESPRPDERRPEPVSEIDPEMNSLEEKTFDQPYNKEARIKLAQIYKNVGRKEDAIFQYLEVIRIESIEREIKDLTEIVKTKPELNIDLANKYKEIGDLDNAMRYYEDYIKYIVPTLRESKESK